ncbi:MAG: hypothetical protein WC390_11845 [Sulfurimonas sp.]|jgi:hypothetical protein
MAGKTKVTKKDLKKGTKRVNITLSIKEFDSLSTIAEFKGIEHTTAAKMLLIPEINKEIKRILVTEKYTPENQRGIKAL